MKTTIIAFSPTGGTMKVAQALATSFCAEPTTIDLTQLTFAGSSIVADDVVIIATPSYSGRVPQLAAERLRQIVGNGAKAVVVAVYGNRAYEDTLVELSDVATQCGFRVVAGVSAVARHSIVTKIATQRPDDDDCLQLKKFGEQIVAKLQSNDISLPAIPGNRPYRKAGAGLVPRTNKQCNSCGKCAAVCPSGAIDVSNPRKIDKAVCINCMRCVSVCPVGAKYVSRMMTALVGMVLKKPCATRKAIELFI